MAQGPRILAFAGSLRVDSYNKKLVRVAAEGARKAGAEVEVIDLRDFPLPVYDADLERSDGLPDNALKLKEIMSRQDGYLIASPEYNSSITAVLKNTIDWVSRGDDGLTGIRGKVAALVSASTGALGGLRGLVHLRAILQNIGLMVIPLQKAVPTAAKAFTPDGGFVDEKTREAVEAVGSRLAEVAAKLKA